MIIPFPGHKWKHCVDRHCHGCMLCHGGLSVCERCGGSEGALPTDCPGERMAGVEIDRVYAGQLDYDRRLGWVERSSVNSPAHYR